LGRRPRRENFWEGEAVYKEEKKKNTRVKKNRAKKKGAKKGPRTSYNGENLYMEKGEKGLRGGYHFFRAKQGLREGWGTAEVPRTRWVGLSAHKSAGGKKEIKKKSIGRNTRSGFDVGGVGMSLGCRGKGDRSEIPGKGEGGPPRKGRGAFFSFVVRKDLAFLKKTEEGLGLRGAPFGKKGMKGNTNSRCGGSRRCAKNFLQREANQWGNKKATPPLAKGPFLFAGEQDKGGETFSERDASGQGFCVWTVQRKLTLALPGKRG